MIKPDKNEKKEDKKNAPPVSWASNIRRYSTTDEALTGLYGGNQAKDARSPQPPTDSLPPTTRTTFADGTPIDIQKENTNLSEPIENAIHERKDLNSEPQSVKAAGSRPKETIKAQSRRNLMGRSKRMAVNLSGQGRVGWTPQGGSGVLQMLPGKSADLYRVLYEATHGHNPPQTKTKKTKEELKALSGIVNDKTFKQHEKYLLGLKLIQKEIIPGDWAGATYTVNRLEDIGISDDLAREFYNTNIAA